MVQLIIMISHDVGKIVWVLISWLLFLLQNPADLDLKFLLEYTCVIVYSSFIPNLKGCIQVQYVPRDFFGNFGKGP